MLQIGEAAALLGITPKAIRHYHQIGLLDEPPRAENGYRLYGVTELQRLQLIQRLQNLGLSLKQIKFVLDADDPDGLLHTLLENRRDTIQGEVERLQAQQTRIERFLDSDVRLSLQTLPLPDQKPAQTSSGAVRHAIAPLSGELADILLALESDVLAQIDHYQWDANYEAFWYQVGRSLALQLQRREHQFILWMERYLALAAMPLDDPQARVWLAELEQGSDRRMLAAALRLPPAQPDDLPTHERARIEVLVPLMLLAEAAPLQQRFLALLLDA